MKNNYHSKVYLPCFVYLLLVFILLMSGQSRALEPKKAITQYVHEIWNTDRGLPQNSVYSILQTRDGYLWLGTEEGLVRFDGVRFTIYNRGNTPVIQSNLIWDLYESKDGSIWVSTHNGGLTRLKNGTFTTYTTDQGLSNNYVRAVTETPDGTLWIGTREGGLNRLKDGQFTAYTISNGLSSNRIRCITADSAGDLWIGTYDGGLNRMRDGKFTSYTTKDGLTNNETSSLYIDKEGTLWVGTIAGLNRFRDQKITAFTTKDGLSHDDISAVLEDRDGNLWIGTSGGGLNRMHDGKITTFGIQDGLLNDEITSLYEDKEGNLWVGTRGGGLNCFRDGKFITFAKKEGLIYQRTLAIYEDREQNMWIGSEDGLNLLSNGKFSLFTVKEGLSDNKVWSIQEDRNGNLFVGTNYGLNLLRAGKFTTLTTRDGLSDNTIWSMVKGRNGDLWMGTNAGLNAIRAGKVTTFSAEGKISKSIILSLAEDENGDLWIGTDGNGLFRMRNGKFVNFTTKDGLANNSIWSLYADKDRNLWIGTIGNGLNRFRDGKFTLFSSKDGLFDDVVFSILEDGKGNLWMSSSKGVFRVSKQELDDYEQRKIPRIYSVAYGKADGMRSQDCNGGFQPAAWKSKDGRLWFSTTVGVAVVDPENIPVNSVLPPVMIEEVLSNGSTISKSDRLILEPGVEQLEMHYTALSFRVPERVQFRYRLEGYDHHWVDAGTRRTAYYTNLPPGHYTFRVRACNDDGIWNNTGSSLSLYLKPQFFQTWWFYALCGILGVMAVFGMYRLRIRQLKLREQTLVRLVQERTKQLQEMDELKTRFFSNISHELRTPLTLIIGPLENLLNEWLGAQEKGMKGRAATNQIEMVLRNSRRLLRLINQLLDISKLEAGKMELHARSDNIIKFVRETSSLFESLAKRRNIDFQVHSDNENIELYFDAEKMEKILYNLLSNAFKFTPENGKILINIAELSGAVEIAVKDTGTGISKEELPYIFDRFRQVAGSSSKVQEGTGIGLSLVKDLVTLHHGEIRVNSQPGWGSEFILHFKQGKEHLSSAELAEETSHEITGQPLLNQITEMSESILPPETGADSAGTLPVPETLTSAPLVLVVDDNHDVRDYIRRIVENHYRVREAIDGEEGMRIALETIPDIILSDVMMPKLDGYGLLNALRADPKTSHIPVILLTARASEEMRLEGLEKGADDYMSKPFNARELLARIRNLILLRQQERELKRFNEELEQKVREQLNALLRSTRLAQYLPGKLVEKILSSEGEITSQRKKMTIVFTDLRGFSNISDRDEPERINSLLNEYLSEMVTLIEQYGGTLGRFMGDGIMAFFGAPEDMPEKDQAKNAVAMAIAMQKKMKELGAKWLTEGLDHDLKIRIGIHQDYVTVGNFGSHKLKEYTVIGKGANLASRLENACTPGKIMVSFAIYSMTRNDFHYDELQEREFKGFARAIRVCELNPEGD